MAKIVGKPVMNQFAVSLSAKNKTHGQTVQVDHVQDVFIVYVDSMAGLQPKQIVDAIEKKYKVHTINHTERRSYVR